MIGTAKEIAVKVEENFVVSSGQPAFFATGLAFQRSEEEGKNDIKNHLETLRAQFLRMDSNPNQTKLRDQRVTNTYSLSDISNVNKPQLQFITNHSKPKSMLFGTNETSNAFGQNPLTLQNQPLHPQLIRSNNLGHGQFGPILQANALPAGFQRYHDIVESQQNLTQLNLFQLFGNDKQLAVSPINYNISNGLGINQNNHPGLQFTHPTREYQLDAHSAFRQKSQTLLDLNQMNGISGGNFQQKIASMGLQGSMLGSHNNTGSLSTAFSYKTPNETVRSLCELPEMNENTKIPSFTSLDEEIIGYPKSQGKANSPSANIQRQFEGLKLEQDETDSSSRYSAQPSNGNLHYSNSFSLPDFSGLKVEDKGLSYIGSVPGIYTKEERALRILKYKKKIVKWRVTHPVARSFSGRRAVAVAKPRLNGRFISNEEYKRYLEKKKEEESIRDESASKGSLDTKIEECN